MDSKKRAFVLKQEVLEWVETLVWASAIVVLVFTFLGRTATVSGHSMNPGYHHGDRIIISNFLYTPAYGDVVVFSSNNRSDEDTLIKRVIATQGQTIDIDFDTGEVKVDGTVLNEPYIAELTTTPEGEEFPATVPSGHIFVMGDNRNHSRDSRDASVGMVDTRQLLGNTVLRFFPADDFGPAV